MFPSCLIDWLSGIFIWRFDYRIDAADLISISNLKGKGPSAFWNTGKGSADRHLPVPLESLDENDIKVESLRQKFGYIKTERTRQNCMTL